MIRPALIAAVLLCSACAQVREPQGGPKDTAAPRLLAAEPANGSTQFSGNTMVLHFDERVQLDRVRENLLVSPPLDKAPAVAVSRGTDVVITLGAPLAPNTTYTFNIGEAVKDLSEGNTAAGLAYVISTGSYVDSLSIRGRVLDAFAGTPAADVQVLLHAAADTGSVRTAPPAYFTRTAADGTFELAHLRSGAMHLTALRDRNANYRYDLPNEEVAFLDSTVLAGDTVPQELFLFRPVPSVQYITGATVLPERGWQFVLSRHADTAALHSLDREGGRLAWWPEWNNGRDTVVMWPSDTTLLNGQRFVVDLDGQRMDTLTYRAKQAMPFNLAVTATRHPVRGEWSLVSTRPVATVDADRAELRLDTVPVPWHIPPDSIHGRTLGLDLEPPPGKSYSLVLYPHAVTGVMGGTNDTTRLVLGTPEPRTFGKLDVQLPADSGRTVPGPFLLQLIGPQGRVVRSAVLPELPGHASWKDIMPGSYGLKLVRDSNGDGRWTTGNFEVGRQPERVWLDPEPLTIRAGWAVQSTWKVMDRP